MHSYLEAWGPCIIHIHSLQVVTKKPLINFEKDLDREQPRQTAYVRQLTFRHTILY